MKFLCDNHLGKLVRLLRMAGFDTIENKNHIYEEMLEQSLNENWILVSRDSKLNRRIKKEKLNIQFIKIESIYPDEQLKQVIEDTGIEIDFEIIFTRCPLCNSKVIPVEKEKIADKIPAHAYKIQEKFWVCPQCNKYYWSGTHRDKILKRFKKM